MLEAREMMGMKRAAFLAAALLAVLLAPAAAAGELQAYEIPELDLRLELPKDCVVLTPEDGVFLRAVRTEPAGAEIIVTGAADEMEDYASFSRERLEDLLEMWAEVYRAGGSTVYSSELWPHPQTTFLKITYAVRLEDGSQRHGVCCSTHCGGRSVFIELRSRAGPAGRSQEAELRESIGRLRFGYRSGGEPEEQSPPAAFVYQDPGMGMTLPVPAGWEEGLPYEQEGLTGVRFLREGDPELEIRCAGMDVFRQLPLRERKGLRREDFDSGLLAAGGREGLERLARTIAGREAVLRRSTRRTIGEEEYRVLELEGGERAGERAVALARMENGCLYLFLFTGPLEHPRFADLTYLVRGAGYAEIRAGGGQEAARRLPLALLLALAVNGVPPAFYRLVLRRRPLSQKAAEEAAAAWGAAAFLLLLPAPQGGGIWLTGPLTLLWGFVNARLLCFGGPREQEAAGQTNPPPDSGPGPDGRGFRPR